MKPLIAITATTEELRNKQQITIPAAYAKAVEDAGGIPVILPVLSRKENITSIVDSFDGFLFSGGDDIRPSYYGEEQMPHLRDTELSPDERTDFEIAILKDVMALEKPVLGICLGMQLINVALGGRLIQDIPTQITNPLNHRQYHIVELKEGTLLHRIMKEIPPIQIISHHHQSVKSPGNGLIISAVSKDGVIEAIELPEYPFLIGVQWHPERALEDEYTRRLFKAFVDAC